MVVLGSLALVVSSPVLSGQGESNLGCQVAREGRESPVPQLSDNDTTTQLGVAERKEGDGKVI